MDLGELASVCGAALPDQESGRVRVCDLTEDSRTVVPGSLFVARRGLKSDGRRFVADAVGAGAVAVLSDDEALKGTAGVPVVVVPDIARATAKVAERFYGNPSDRLGVIAVTGTNGKTTTAYLVWQILNAAGVRCGLMGTVEIDDGAAVSPASMTTPPAIEVSRSLSIMAENGCRAVVLEASSHALDQGRVDGLKIGVGVFTNLTGDHLDYHGTMERYGAAKARLFSMIGPGSTAVVNADDPAHRAMVRDCRASVVTCGISAAGPDATAEVLGESIEGMQLRLKGPWGTATARVPLIGRYNAMNTLEAAAACHAVLGSRGGMGVQALEAALLRVKPPPGRLEPVCARGTSVVRSARSAGPARPRVFVDFAHSDDALRSVLTAARRAMGGSGQLWTVFGCGGDKDRTKRPRMGLAAAEIADRVVVTSDNPRSEKPCAIVGEVVAGIPEHLRSKVVVHVERAAAIRFAVRHAAPGDVVIIAGKGHETEQIMSNERGEQVRSPFDDREIAAAAMGEVGSASRQEQALA